MPSFDELTNEFLDAEFAESPVRASGLGLTEYDELLDDLSEAAFERRRRADATWLERFRGVDEERSASTIASIGTSSSARCAGGRSWRTSRSGAGSPTSTSIPA